MLQKEKPKKYGKSMCDLYIPAMASALDLHIRVLEFIGGYYAVLNTFPSNHTNSRNVKTVNLTLKEDKYKPVVYMKEKEAEIDVEITDVIPPPTVDIDSGSESADSSVQITGYTPPPDPEKRRKINNHAKAILDNIKNEVKVELDRTPSSDESSLPSIHYPPKVYKKKEFDMAPFLGMVPDLVDRIPHDVDGLRYFIIDVPEDTWYCPLYHDGRNFTMNTSKRKGFEWC